MWNRGRTPSVKTRRFCQIPRRGSLWRAGNFAIYPVVLPLLRKPSPLGGKVAANIVSRRMRGTGKQQLAVRPHQSPAVTASPDRGKPSGTANFAVYPVALPPCQGPHPRGGCLRSRLGEFSPQSVRISAFPSLKVKNPAEKRFRWFKNRFGCAILGVKVPVWTGNRRA